MFGATSEPEPFYPVSNPKHPTSSFRSEKMPGAILRISFYNSPISSVAPFPLSTKTGTKIIPSFHLFLPSSSPLFTISSPCTAAIQKSSRTYQTSTFCTSYEIGGGFSDNDVGGYDNEQAENIWDSATYEALLSGGEQVTSVLQEMIGLLEDMNMDETSEAGVVELVAQGVIGKRVDEMEFGFMLALDYMIQRAEKDNDDQGQTSYPAFCFHSIQYEETMLGMPCADCLQLVNNWRKLVRSNGYEIDIEVMLARHRSSKGDLLRLVTDDAYCMEQSY